MTILTEAFYSVDDFLLLFFLFLALITIGIKVGERTRIKNVNFFAVVFFGWRWIIHRPYPALRVLMERPSDLFTYLCLEVGTSYVSDLFEDLVGNNALSSQRTVIDVLRFIYLFIFFLFFWFCFSRRCAHVADDSSGARLCRKTSFILPWLDELPKSHYKTEFGTWQHPFFSLSLLQCRYFLFVCVSDHFFFVVHFFLLKTANRFLHSIFGICGLTANRLRILIRSKLHCRVCVCL